MTRCAGKIGYGVPRETDPGVYEYLVTERHYYGDVKQSNRKLRDSDDVNPNVVLQNIIEIMADQFVWDNIDRIIYILWNGVRWNISGVEVKRPRLILTIGDVYNGPTP